MELRRVLPPWSFYAVLLIILAALVAGRTRDLPTSGLLGASLGVFLLLWGYFALSDARFQNLLVQWCRISRARRIALACCLGLPYLAYSLPLHCFSATGFLALLLY